MLIQALMTLALAIALLVISAYGAGRLTAKLVGLSSFRLFDVRAPGSHYRRFIVFLGCALAPLATCVVAMFLGVFASGQSYGTNRVEVIPGSPAERGGLLNGDRVIAVDGQATPDFDMVKSIIRSRATPHMLSVERNGGRQNLTVAPDAQGKVGLTAIMQERRASVSEAFSQAVRTPWSVWGAILSPARKAELVGPIGIVRAVADARAPNFGAYVHLVGLLECGLLWVVPMTFFSDWLTWLLFKWSHAQSLRNRAPDSKLFRVRRLHHAMKVNLIGLVLSAAVLVWVDASHQLSGGPVRAWFAWLEAALIPLVWLDCREFHTRKRAVSITLLMFIPLVNIAVLLWRTEAAAAAAG
jgi:hypothetical protein